MRATFFWSALSTMLSVSRWRLRLVVFEVRMWRLNACPRLNLPVPVFLKRLAAPLCVLSFGIAVLLVYNKTAGTGQQPLRAQVPLCCVRANSEPRSNSIHKSLSTNHCFTAAALAAFAAARGQAVSAPLEASRELATWAEPGPGAACCLPAADETPRSPNHSISRAHFNSTMPTRAAFPSRHSSWACGAPASSSLLPVGQVSCGSRPAPSPAYPAALLFPPA